MLVQIGANFITQQEQKDTVAIDGVAEPHREPGHRPLIEDIDLALGTIDQVRPR